MPTVLALDRVLARQSTQTFGRYELLGRLGAGGMAEVFVARCGELQGMQSLLALKRILPHLADDEGFVSLFQREAQISLRLRHRAIARVFEVGRVGPAWFLAMELVPGESLAQVFRAESEQRVAVDPRVVAFVGAEIASALHHAHALTEGAAALSVIHRDVSPQNLLLGFEGSAKLIDFGVARCARLSDATRTGTVRGKLAYASPEQVSARALDGRSDLFSLASVLHEWLSGAPLFACESDAATVRAVQAAAIPPLTAWPRLDRVLARALARQPEARFPDGEAMAEALLEAVGGRPGSPERLVGAHLKALFPDRERRWQAIVTGGEVGSASVETAIQPRGETVRGTPPSAAPTRALAPGSPRPSRRRSFMNRRGERRTAVLALAAAAALGSLLVTWRSHDRAIASRPAAPAASPGPASALVRSATATAANGNGNCNDNDEVSRGAAPVSAGRVAHPPPGKSRRHPVVGRPQAKVVPAGNRNRAEAELRGARRAVVDELEPSPYATPR